MQRRSVVRWGLAFLAVTIVAVLWIDAALAASIAPTAKRAVAITNPMMEAIEVIFGFPLSKWLTGFVILVAGLVAAAWPNYRRLAWLLVFIGASQLTARLIAGVLKNVFARPRPHDVLAGRAPDFFTDGSSFPSGHAAHFWPLFFAIALAFRVCAGRFWLWRSSCRSRAWW